MSRARARYRHHHPHPHYSEGLGVSSIEQNQGAISTVLQAVPGVGPILSTLFNIGENIFGHGDPTPMATYFAAIIQLRLAIAQAHNALGEADDFHLPPGMDTASANEIANLAMYIVNDELKRAPNATTLEQIENMDWSADHYQAVHDAPGPWSAYQGSNERDYVTSVVKRLQAQLQGLQLEAQSAAIAPPPSSPASSSGESTAGNISAPPNAPQAPGAQEGGAVGAASPPAAPLAPPVIQASATPMLIAGGAFLLLMILGASSAKGGSA